MTYIKYSNKIAYEWFKINNVFILKHFLDLKQHYNDVIIK